MVTPIKGIGAYQRIMANSHGLGAGGSGAFAPAKPSQPTPMPNAFGESPDNLVSKMGNTGFTGLVRHGVNSVIQDNEHAEIMTIKGITGQADMVEVATAVAEAEASLRTMVTIRDKIIMAYQEIIKMPV